MKSRVDILLEARDMISDRDSWYKYRYHNLDHTKHCLMGAVSCARSGHTNTSPLVSGFGRAEEALALASLRLYGINVQLIKVNDHLGYDIVMEILDEAIRIAKDEE